MTPKLVAAGWPAPFSHWQPHEGEYPAVVLGSWQDDQVSIWAEDGGTELRLPEVRDLIAALTAWVEAQEAGT